MHRKWNGMTKRNVEYMHRKREWYD